ncbi:uncharacterized protein B0H18DRAFT_868820 [Fomitopsis serialis]|uniref:uncharacterized protein n=1 Tax=Fomitopsis serialis TaxID=139415 RepID=UPI0020077582|nr:uncharacterized protein B0H18DRAFT_868820 [Neoantrodia serialis]KAH9935709.1 hypothetical protein B0H18DRAFT_868820 [Neoantrodia serialis]
MVFGGLSAMFYGGHPYLSVGMFLRKVDMRTVFFATVFVIVLLVLAYLTNPSENSFRHYLTEQSFRQHLKRLDENQDDEGDSKDAGTHASHSRRSPPIAHKPGRDRDPQPPFHFINRASISLRTPKHVSHSFGVLTIAAVFPSPHGSATLATVAAQATVNDSWFIGAFGRWWRGGTIRAWWHGALIDQKDAERLNSGILDLKALDSLESYDGLPFAASASLHLPTTDSDKKLRGTERPTQRTVTTSLRSTTPPPLPKSASLPLHAPRQPATSPKTDRSRCEITPRTNHTSPQATSCTANDVLKITPSLSYSPSSTSLFDQSPVITDILRQIAHSNGAVVDLRTQLADFHSAATQGHAAIQSELDEHRARKRGEDASRLELKTKTKTLEDEKRAAESGKREAEKRLKVAESARDKASRRMERLDRDMGALEERIKEDEDAVRRAQEEGEKSEREAAEELQRKQKEIRVAEDVIAALSLRAKELEESIAQEEERLRRTKEQAELRKQDRSFYPLHVVPTVEEDDTTLWSPTTAYSQSQTQVQDPLTTLPTDMSCGLEFPPSVQVTEPPSVREPRSAVSPRPKTLSLGGISNFRDRLRPEGMNNDAFVRPQYPFLLENSSTPLSNISTRFSPFADTDAEPPSGTMQGGEAISPRSTSLIPSSLISSLESIPSMEDMSRSFQSDADDVMDPNWRAHRSLQPPVEHPSAITTSPTSITNPSFDGVDREDPFEIRLPPLSVRRRLASETVDSPRSMMSAPSRTISDPESIPQIKAHELEDKTSIAHRRWNSVDPKERKGLNPEAKVFRLQKKSLPSFFPPQSAPASGGPSFDPVVGKPPGLSVPQIVTPESDSLFSSITMRAFAPSPAEREALQRVLGSSTNTSLERLPTLSEVSLRSMPSSPSHVNAAAAPLGAEAASRTLLPPGPSWLQSLPRARKPAFSPWDDEEEGKRDRERR